MPTDIDRLFVRTRRRHTDNERGGFGSTVNGPLQINRDETKRRIVIVERAQCRHPAGGEQRSGTRLDKNVKLKPIHNT